MRTKNAKDMKNGFNTAIKMCLILIESSPSGTSFWKVVQGVPHPVGSIEPKKNIGRSVGEN